MFPIYKHCLTNCVITHYTNRAIFCPRTNTADHVDVDVLNSLAAEIKTYPDEDSTGLQK